MHDIATAASGGPSYTTLDDVELYGLATIDVDAWYSTFEVRFLEELLPS